MNEKYDIIQIPMFKCCTCGKNVPEDSIILNNDRLFNCPHCNKTATDGQIVARQPKEKKLCVVYLAKNGKEILNREAWYKATMKRYEMKEDFKNYELADI